MPYPFRCLKYYICLFLVVFTLVANAQEVKDYKNFYGISWRGNPHENLVYARQMGYDYVFYQPGMEKDSLATGMRFYIESPEYFIYERIIDLNKKYSKAQISFYEKYCVLNENKKQFPDNIATGWVFTGTTFSAQLNYRDKKVRNWTIKSILKFVKDIESRNPGFKFGGYAWDVPQLSGDFWSGPLPKRGKQVTYKFFQNEKNKANNGFYEGYVAFYKKLFADTRKAYPGSRYIIEPYKIMDDWMSEIEKRPDAKDLMPDIICQEITGRDFIEDPAIFKSGLITRDRVFCTSSSIFSHQENLEMAALASVNGSFFSWFGRYGGSGDTPNYKRISEVPDRLKLIRVLTNWENSNNVALKDRKWVNGIYSSPCARATKNLIALKKPGADKIFIVFIDKDESYNVPDGYKIERISGTDGSFCENGASSELVISKNNVFAKDAALGKGYIISLAKQ